MAFYTPRNISPADQLVYDASGNLVGIRAGTSGDQAIFGLNEAEYPAVQALVSGAGVFGIRSAAAAVGGATDWTLLTLAAGITSTDAAVRVNGGEYEFRGLLTGSITEGMLVATLPVGLPPVASAAQTVATSSVGPVMLTVDTVGAMRVTAVGGSPAWVSIAGSAIPMAPHAAGTDIAVTPTLPVVRIETMGQEIPAPALDTYISGFITIEPNGSDLPSVSRRAIDISGHGNSTWSLPKKPLKLRFPSGQATSVLGMPASRHWRALANFYDRTQLRNAIAFEMMRRIYSPWTPRSVFAELFIDGLYQGVFQITESVRAEPDRLPVSLPSASATGLDATGAFMMEINTRYVAEGEPGFTTATSSVPIQFDDPSPPSASQITYITGWMNTFDATLMGASWLDPVNGYAKYVDMTSWADWYLVSELTRNQDSAFFASCKLYKERDTAAAPGRLRMGPLWDSDLSLGNGYNIAASIIRDWSGNAEAWHTRQGVWLNRMLSDPAFVAVVAARWALLRDSLYGSDGVVEWARTLALRLSYAAAADGRRWGYDADIRSRAELVFRWLRRRVAWLDPRIKTPVVVNRINNPRPASALTGFAAWAGTGGAGSLALAAGNPLGGNAARYTWSTGTAQAAGIYISSIPVTPGETITFTAAVRASKKQNLTVRAEVKNGSNATIATLGVITGDTSVDANTLVQSPAVSAVIPAGAATVTLLVYSATGASWAVNDWLEVCGAMVVGGAIPNLRHADPDTTATWSWDGTAFASNSRGWPL